MKGIRLMTNLENKTETTDTLNDRYLLFTIDGAYYGLPLALATEILTLPSITRLPRVADYVKGIINLRGKVIPVLDVRMKLGLPEHPFDENNAIIVISIREMPVGLIVDMVSEVVTVPHDKIIPPPKTITDKIGYIGSVSQIDTKVVLNLNCEEFFHNDFEQIT
jgi:purine-binding chemotaxis protein CheW